MRKNKNSNRIENKHTTYLWTSQLSTNIKYYWKLLEIPPKKSNIERSIRHVRQISASKSAEPSNERDSRWETDRIRTSTSRAVEKSEK